MATSKRTRNSAPKSSSFEDYLVSYGVLAPNNTSKAADILLSVQPSLTDIAYKTASSYVDTLWKKIQTHKKFNPSLGGSIFELVIACVLIQEDILPFYWQAEVEFVPLAIFDLVVYTKEVGPVVLSLKTSLRERYKQEEFEAQALKNVHKHAKTFLVTMDGDDASKVNEKIKKGIISGVDKAIVANRIEFNRVIDDIKKLTMIVAPKVSVISDGKRIDRQN